LIALKYPAQEGLATSRMCGVSLFRAVLAALWYSPRRMVRWGVHQGLEQGEGLDTSVCSLRRATRRLSDSEIHSFNFGRVGHDGAAGPLKSLRIGFRVSQSVSAHLGRGGFWFREGVARVIVIGMWSDPVEGREASQLFTRGRRRGFAKRGLSPRGRHYLLRGTLCVPPGH